MRKIFYAFLLLLLAQWGNAQSFEHCGTMANRQMHLDQNPALAQQLEQAEAKAANWLKNHPEAKTAGVATIPVVVHVLYKNAAQNISDAQIQSQIDILNQDYRKLNPDTANRRAMFDTLAADVEIEFCLASVDPNGNPTTGINRVSTTGGQFFGYFGPLDDAKAASSGGADPWPADQYLNIWVCDLVPIILGYAQFPGDDPTTDGVVIGFNYFGNMGTVSAPYNKGRTTSHEVGHWLGLRHIWGDGDCTEDDFVDDTPRSDAANQGGCLLNENSCVDSVFDYPDMVENYMDYSDDGCMNMLTHGQKARIWSFLNTDRVGLLSSGGCSVASAIENPKATDRLSIYPNPAEGAVQIRWDDAPLTGGSVRVMDITGKTIIQKVEENISQLDLSDFQPGMYIFHIARGDNNYYRNIIIH